MKISFGNMTLEVNVFNIAKQQRDDDECIHTYMIGTVVEEEAELRKNPDSLKHFIRNSDRSNPVELEEISTLFDDS